MELARARDDEPEQQEQAELWGDPSPETNLSITAVRPGSRLAAERALGRPEDWAADLGRVALVPALVGVVTSLAITWVPWARPSALGLLAAAAVAFALARAVGRAAPRALAYARRVPLVLVAVASGGLGACVGGAAAAVVVLGSPSLEDGASWILTGASFGLAYTVLLFLPLLLTRLGRLAPTTLFAAQGVASVLATMYAGWNASGL